MSLSPRYRTRPAPAASVMLPVAGDDAITLGLLRGDPLYRYIVPGSAQSMVAAALEEGRCAQPPDEEHLWQRPAEDRRAAQCADSVSRMSMPAGARPWCSPSTLTRPVSITLYRPAIERVERVLREVGMDIWLRTADLRRDLHRARALPSPRFLVDGHRAEPAPSRGAAAHRPVVLARRAGEPGRDRCRRVCAGAARPAASPAHPRHAVHLRCRRRRAPPSAWWSR